MRTKNERFFAGLIANSYDIVLLCETWLNEDFYDSEFFDNRYVVFRIDRKREGTGMSRGGGCLMAIKSELSSMRMREWELDKEDVWISVVHENGFRTNFNVRYVEDGSSLLNYEVHFKRISDVITSAGINDNFVLFGDYNLSDSVEWYDENGVYDVKVNSGTRFDKRIPHELINLNALCNLREFSSVRNGLNRTLDLVLSDVDSSKIEGTRCCSPLLPEDSHHPALNVNLDLSPVKCLSERRPPKTNFYKADYRTLNQRLLDVEWGIELSGVGN